MSLSRGKMLSSNPLVVCGDCGAAEPTWASLNRGVLICVECCSVHRSLGRHVSQIRSLKKGAWHCNQLALVHTLYNNGANNIWEHLLLDPHGAAKLRMTKPTPRDPVYPSKAEFIRAKYSNLSFACRPSKDEPQLNVLDLNAQLHSCARTAHVETTLRLLMLGAEPNHIDRHKQNTPMHVAAKEGQSLQVELLFLYGGDPAHPDGNGRKASEVAVENGHPELADRLCELEYEATDRLSMYLCSRKPDHTSAQHFLIPEMSSATYSSNTQQSIMARRRLQMLSHQVFEKVLQDVYDEVDRRETDASWMASQQDGATVNERYIVPFLPVNPQFSSTRNQSRQKLAKFNAREFANLIIDVLSEAKRRCSGLSLQDVMQMSTENIINSSDPNISKRRTTSLQKSEEEQEGGPDYDHVADGNDQSPPAVEQTATNENQENGVVDPNNLVTVDDYLEIREQLVRSEDKVEKLSHSNEALMRQLSHLQSSVEQLMEDNVQLRIEVKTLANDRWSPQSRDDHRPISRPTQLQHARSVSDSFPHAPRVVERQPPSPNVRRKGSVSSPASMSVTQYDSLSTSQTENQYSPIHKSTFPNNLILDTEKLTKVIQNLLSDAQKGSTARFSQYAAQVQYLSDGMISTIPESVRTENVDFVVKSLNESGVSLRVECAKTEQPSQDQCAQVVQAAFQVAKAAKHLLVTIQR